MPARVLLLVLVLLASFATAFAASGVTVSGGSPAQRRLARELLDRLQPRRLASVTFERSTHPPFRGQEMDIAGTDRTVREWWEESFFAAAFVRGSKTLGLPEPRLVVYSSGAFTPVHGPGPPGPRASREALVRYLSGLRTAAANANARVLHLRAYRLGPVGVAITIQVGDPAPFLKFRARRFLRALDAAGTGIFARYLGLLDSSGTRVWEVADFPQSSGVYIEPDLRGCNPIATLGVPGQKIPPCPA